MRYLKPLLKSFLIIGVILLFVPCMVRGASSDVDAGLPGGSGVSMAKLNVGLLKSDYTSRYFAEKWQYEQVIYRWLTFLAESGIRHRLVADSELEDGGTDEFTVLVLPAALCLSEGERSAVRRLLSQGKGIVASWGLGARSHDGSWEGWDFLEEFTQSRFGGYLGGRPAAWVTFSGRSPLSVGLGPGFRLELIGGWKVVLETASRDGFWSDYNLNPWTPDSGTSADAAVVHASLGRGRTAWFGFNVTEVTSNTANQNALRKLLLNAVRWAGRVPISDVWYWPDYHQGAAVFSQDVEYLFHNAAASVDALSEEGISGTFFCVSDLAADNRELVEAFAKIGEVGSHSDDHQQFKGQPFDVQYRRLEKSANALSEMGSVEIKGMRPPYELCDEATLKAWAILGGEYVFGQPEYSPRMIPELYRVPKDAARGLEEEKTLVLLPRAVRDDHTVLVVEALDTNDEIFEQHRHDMKRVYDLSGLCMFGYHSNLLCLPERVEILSRMIRYAKTLDLWLTTAGDIARWWRIRSGVSAALTGGDDGRIVLSVRNAGGKPAKGVALVVYLPGVASDVRLTGNSPDIPAPRLTIRGERLIVYLDVVEPDAVNTYEIELL